MFSWQGPLPDPDIRTIEDMLPVLSDPACRSRGPLYLMYRDLAMNHQDRLWLSGNRLRYDITVIRPIDLCGEKAKTKGHYHPINRSGAGYPEVYEVLEGRAHYLLQRCDLASVVMVRAEKGDLVLVPPFYGHVTINAGSGDLVMANLVSSAFASEYAEFERRRGAAYYECSDGRIVKNPLYGPVTNLRMEDAGELSKDSGLPGCGLYDMIGNEILGFLNNPEKYPVLFSRFP